MKKFRTVRQTGIVRPKGSRRQAGLAMICAGLLICTGNWFITANAEEIDATDSTDTSETAESDAGVRELSISSGTNSSITQAEEEDNSSDWEGLYLEKYLTDNEDGTLQVTLESYVTGDTTKMITDEPADILLLLDASDSMAFSIYDGTSGGSGGTRLAALQEGAASFIETIREQNSGLDEADQSRIAIMGFNWNILTDFANEDGDYFMAVDNADHQDNASTLMNYISSWSGYIGSGTSTGAALEAAGVQLSELASDYTTGNERRQVIILFTDGWPTFAQGTVGSVQGFWVEEAQKALQAAYTLKQNGVEIYCVSVAVGVEAQEGEAFPDYEKEGFDGSYLSEDPVHYLSDEMNTQLKEAVRYTGDDYDLYVNTSDENARNIQSRFMYLLSSDNPNANDLDDDGVTTGGYFYTAHDSDNLTAVFETLAEMVGSASVELGVNSEVRDYVTDEFAIADVSAVKLYTAAYNGDGTWADSVEIEDPQAQGYSVTVDGSSVVVSGFDYAAHYVSTTPHTGTDSYYGCKLIITFPITVSEDTFGGNVIPTNESSSGLYMDSGTDTPMETFEVPYADVELLYEIQTGDAEYFVPDMAELENILSYADGYQPDGSNNAYVNIVYTMTDADGNIIGTLTIPAGTAADSCSWEWNTAYTDGTVSACGEYMISCVVSPLSSGTYESISRSGEGQIHIYYPEITFCDTSQELGAVVDIEQGDLTDSGGLGEHLASVRWVCPEGETKTVYEGPALGYRVSITGGVETDSDVCVIASTADVPIVIGVYRTSDDVLTDDITAYTLFCHECGSSECGYDEQEQYADLGVRCLIHVTTTSSGDTSSGTGSTDADEEEDTAEDTTVTTTVTATVTDNTVVEAEEVVEITAPVTSSYGSGEETVTTPDREVPLTGDATEFFLWLVCAGGAVIGIACCVLFIRRNKIG